MQTDFLVQVGERQRALQKRAVELTATASKEMESLAPAYVAAILAARELLRHTTQQLACAVQFGVSYKLYGEHLAPHLEEINGVAARSLVAVEAMLMGAERVLSDEEDNRYVPGFYRVEHAGSTYPVRGPYMVRAISRSDARRVALAAASGRQESEITFEHCFEQLVEFPMGVLVVADQE